MKVSNTPSYGEIADTGRRSGRLDYSLAQVQVDQLAKEVGHFLDLAEELPDDRIGFLKDLIRAKAEAVLRTLGRDGVWEGFDALYGALRSAAHRALRIIDEWPAPVIDLFEENNEEGQAA